MRVVLTADALKGPQTGIGVYTRNLLNGLSKHSRIEDLQLLDGPRTRRASDAPSPSPQSTNSPGDAPRGVLRFARRHASRSRLIVNAYDIYLAQSQKRALHRLGSDYVLHSPNYLLPIHVGATVVTIPDLSTVTCPQYHPPARVDMVNRHIRNAIRGSDHIIAISNTVAESLMEEFGVREDRISVTYLGASDDFRPAPVVGSCDAPIFDKLQHKQYFLFVGTIEPRKNIERLLDAYLGYRADVGSNAYPLVMTGYEGWLSKATRDRIARLESDHCGVRYLGYSRANLLPHLIAGARALLYPALYEGFGLPVLEAMQSATAVLTSRGTAMEEIGGSSVHCVDAESIDDIAQGIGHLASNDRLREELESSGLLRSREFSWKNCVSRTVEAYEKVEKGANRYSGK